MSEIINVIGFLSPWLALGLAGLGLTIAIVDAILSRQHKSDLFTKEKNDSV